MQSEPSFHHFHVQHYCPLAQTLERLGDRWSFLVVRDLMRGPQRFTDLQRYLAGITPKRLTAQLRALETEGIVEREREKGRREVWYHLTEKGQGLVPAIKALTVWGVEYTMRTPLPGETVYPENIMGVLSITLNQRGLRLPQPVTWIVNFEERGVFTISFDGKQWSVEPIKAPEVDVYIETTPETWAALLLSPRDEGHRHLEAMRISGEKSRVDEFLAFNWREK
ncbi:MAG TPA: helix-turn-helix domain-containing protein [Ktedonobacteraceae bacterium]|jgi:DNA-binding HxlR family transcriptional regulator